MNITFHCEHCGKKIEAPDIAGGRWGKCPACHKKVYVPKVDLEDDELRLAPLDDEEEKARRKFLAEEVRLREDILSETDVPEEPKANEKTEPPQGSATLSDSELMEAILTYLRSMADGELEQAEQTAGYIAPCSKRAVAILDRIALSEIPQPEIADIPPQVLSGLIRKLRARIGH